MPTTPGLILASTSVYRRELLGRLRLPFTVERPQVDEGPLPGELPLPRAQRLALAKAFAVSELAPGSVVIGADQVATCDGRILDKPGGAAAAREQLAAQSGRAVQFFSAVAVVHAGPGFSDRFVDLTTVIFRTLNATEIEAYIASREWRGKAGGYAIQGLAGAFVQRIVGSYTNVVGLPLIRLAASLRSCGYALP